MSGTKRPQITIETFQRVMELSHDVSPVPPSERRSFEDAIAVICDDLERLKKAEEADGWEGLLES